MIKENKFIVQDIMGFKMEWNKYKERLIHYGYTEEQINEIKKVRESEDFEYMTKEQYDYLVSVGVLVRTRKLKKPRSLFTDGKVVFALGYMRDNCVTASPYVR